MKVYVVYGDTYFEGYGAYINLFGVFSTPELAEMVKKQKEKEYFENENKKSYSLVESEQDVVFHVEEVSIDSKNDICLGGYAE